MSGKVFIESAYFIVTNNERLK